MTDLQILLILAVAVAGLLRATSSCAIGCADERPRARWPASRPLFGFVYLLWALLRPEDF